MQGHTLGGGKSGDGSGSNQPMTAEELRRSRLAALGRGTATRKDPPTAAAAASSATAAGGTVTNPPAAVASSSAFAAVHMDEDAELQRALELSLQQSHSSTDHPPHHHEGGPAPPPQHRTTDETEDSKPAAKESPLAVRKEPYEIAPFHALMWDAQTTTDNDKMRWVGQSIHVVVATTDLPNSPAPLPSANYRHILEQLAQTHSPWGLQQQHGGPCGVLAAVQAEMLRLLLWGPRRSDGMLDFPSSPQQLQPSTHRISDLLRPVMAQSLALILARASLTPWIDDESTSTPRKPVVRIVLPKEGHMGALQWDDMQPWAHSSTGGAAISDRLEVLTLEEELSTLAKRQKRQNESIGDRIRKLAHQVTDFLLQPRTASSDQVPLDYFGNAGGVLLLVMSVVASRGAEAIQKEFDDPVGTRLTAQFGHCSQELMNLLLSGQAVSNVFDNTMNLGESMVCRGISYRPDVGYLTQLEALRYCQVGGYYKSPRFPIWVVGSTSHFTVLFGDSSSLQETESDKLLERCRRAFKEIEGADENGFIPVDQLGKVLKSLKVDVGDNASTLGAHLEVSGAGIILWDDFWKAASRLLTGATLESIVSGSNDDHPPPLIRAGTPPPATAKAAPTHETDEEMARRLASEWESEAEQLKGINFLGEAARAASPIPMETNHVAAAPAAASNPSGMSADEALARKLQAEWDAEMNGSVASGSHQAVGGSPARSDDFAPLPATPPRRAFREEEHDAKQSADRTVRFAEAPKFEFEQYGDSFTLYHYNGLHGGTLTPFRVTRLSPEEAVGASIALNRGHASDGSGDLEDVVRTKWPSCVVDWGGKKPPYID